MNECWSKTEMAYRYWSGPFFFLKNYSITLIRHYSATECSMIKNNEKNSWHLIDGHLFTWKSSSVKWRLHKMELFDGSQSSRGTASIQARREASSLGKICLVTPGGSLQSLPYPDLQPGATQDMLKEKKFNTCISIYCNHDMHTIREIKGSLGRVCRVPYHIKITNIPLSLRI